MKNEEHEKADNTTNNHHSEKNPPNTKSQAMETISHELQILTREINKTQLKFRYLHDFEKVSPKDNKRKSTIIINEYKSIHRRLENDHAIYKDYDNFMKVYNVIRKDKPNNQFMKDNLLVTNCNEIISQKDVEQMQKFYVAAYNMPVKYVLENSKKVVFTEEMIFANEEMNVVKKLKKIQNLRLRNKLQIKKDNNNAMNTEIRFRKLTCKVIAHLCKEFVDNNSLTIDGIKMLFFKSVNIYESRKYEVRGKPSYIKNHADVFEMISVNKSNIRFSIQQPKKYISTHHTSHLNTIRRIQPELNKIQNPCGILEYKDKIKNKSNGPSIRREISNGGIIHASDSVRPEMKKR